MNFVGLPIPVLLFDQRNIGVNPCRKEVQLNVLIRELDLFVDCGGFRLIFLKPGIK